MLGETCPIPVTAAGNQAWRTAMRQAAFSRSVIDRKLTEAPFPDVDSNGVELVDWRACPTVARSAIGSQVVQLHFGHIPQVLPIVTAFSSQQMPVLAERQCCSGRGLWGLLDRFRATTQKAGRLHVCYARPQLRQCGLPFVSPMVLIRAAQSLR